jgi:hypothetical protein
MAKLKIRMFPGDVSRATKIKMVEKGVSAHPELMPNAAKAYKKDLVRAANRRQRREKPNLD